jgi:hypothetical protein
MTVSSAPIGITRCTTYTKPRNRAANRTGNHGTTKWGPIWAQLLRRKLFYGFIDTEVQARSEGVAQSVQMKTGVQATDSVTLDDLPDGLDSAETRLVTQ